MIVIVSDNWVEVNAVLTALGVKPGDAVITTAAAIQDKGGTKATKKKDKAPVDKGHWVTREALAALIQEHAPVLGRDLEKLCPNQSGHIRALLATMGSATENAVIQDPQGFWKVKA